MEIQKQKLITCILPKGIARDVADKLWHEKKINSINILDARRITTLTLDVRRALVMENEVLSVVVTPQQADEIFEYLYESAGIDQPNGSAIYMTALEHGSTFTLPDMPYET